MKLVPMLEDNDELELSIEKFIANAESTEGQLKDMLTKLSPKNAKEPVEDTDEAIVAGLALSSPKIMQIVGKLLHKIGVHLSDEEEHTLVEIGKKLDEIGEKAHHKIVHAIEKILHPAIFHLPKDKRSNVAGATFMGIIAVKLAMTDFVGLAADLAHIGNVIEALLSGIKASEIITFIKKYFAKLLGFFKNTPTD